MTDSGTADARGIIGNCSYSALIRAGAVEWLCWPRFDSSFVFGGLLDRERGGSFVVEGVDLERVEHEYVPRTNVLCTRFHCRDGVFELVDFAPRFRHFGRYFKPTMLVRILRPVEGEPRVRVRCRPVDQYGEQVGQPSFGSNHIDYLGMTGRCRLTTDLSLSSIQEERPFVLSGVQRHLVLTWGQPLEAPIAETAESFLSRTVDYWRTWVGHMRVPREFQDEVIRSALVLKLHQFEDTGAIIASATTSIPEFPGSGRNWDYRYCWLRDAYFTLNAFERLGHNEEGTRFLTWLQNVAANSNNEDGSLQPLYGISGEERLVESVLEHLSGFRFDHIEYPSDEGGEGPVRIGNQAYEHVQNDAYGEVILSVSRLLLDVRFSGSSSAGAADRLITAMLDQIEKRLEEPDAGLWELRNTQRVHSFTVLTHWAGARRAAEVAEVRGDDRSAKRARDIEARARKLLEEQCWNEEIGAFAQAAGADNLDAAMLLMLHFGYFEPGDPRARRHVFAIRDALGTESGLLKRYDVQDDFGHQHAAFTVCSFWLVEALAILGEHDEARELFERLLALHNGLGLFSEDILPGSGLQAGNFPQTYSHVGVINSAFRLARPWH